MIIQKHSRQILASIIALGLCTTFANAGVIHRYSFNDGTAKDSVGKVDGALKGAGATIAGGKLVLKNDAAATGDKISFVQFASSILPKDAKSATLMFWFTAKGTEPYARVVNIGASEGGEGRAFFYFSPRTADGNSRAAITATDVAGRVPLDNTALDDDKPHMVAVVFDGKTNKMHVFIDGKEPTPAEDMGDNTLDKVKTTDNFLGKSSFDVDPGLSASIDEFRVYDQALTADDVTAAFKAGADTVAPVATTQPAPKP